MNQTPIPNFAGALRLDGKNFIVLGAGQGIGEQSAHALAQSGARVLCVDFDNERSVSVAKAVNGIPCHGDVTSRRDMEKIFETASREFNGRLDGIVDVVGMPIQRTMKTLDDESLQRQFDIVLKHVFLALQFGEPLLTRGASVVLVGSMGGVTARGGLALAYSAAKAGLHHLARSAAQELAPRGIRVNVVAPGITRTPRLVDANDQAFWDQQAAEVPLGKPATTTDIANAILFLATPMSGHMTGSVLKVDGGLGVGLLKPLAKSHRVMT